MLNLSNLQRKEKARENIPANEEVRHLSDNEFLSQCKPILDQLEKLRRIKLKVYAFRKKIAYPVLIIGTPLFGYIDYVLFTLPRSGSDDGGAGLTLAFMAGVYWWVTDPKRKYANEYKKQVLPKIAKLFGNFSYDMKGKINMEHMKPSKVVPNHHNYKSEDYFRGYYKNVEIEFSEIHLTETRGSGKNRRTVTVFKGLAILLEMDKKKFYGHTILDKNKSKMGEWFSEKSLDLKKANMVDPEFEKLFDVYTNDQVEARYLVDPHIIEQLKSLYEYYAQAKERDQRRHDPSWIENIRGMYKIQTEGYGNHAKKMMVAYYNSKVLILIGSNYNHFEPADIHVQATDPQSILQMKQEIGDILSIIDKLEAYDPLSIHETVQ